MRDEYQSRDALFAASQCQYYSSSKAVPQAESDKYCMFYVYAYLRKSDNSPYYIGKGKDRRAFERHKGISVPKDKKKIVFLETNLTDIGACAIERRMIRWYGRKDLNQGKLLNRTDGGEGLSGFTMPEESKEKIRQANIGKKHTPESKEKMSIKKLGNTNGVGNKSRTGQHQSEEEREKKRIASIGRAHTEETKKYLSEIKKGIPKPKFECPHCNRLFSPTNLARYHGDKCKLK